MVRIGDRGVVLNGEDFYVPPSVEVGDKVMIYTLGNGQKIAIPTLSLSLDDHVFPTPSFSFAGFDWKIDFNFSLVPLILNIMRIGEVIYVGPQIESRPISQYEEELIGTVFVNYGGGRLFLSNYNDHVYASADDGYRIYNDTNSKMIDLRKSWYGVYQNDPLPEITSIIDLGINKLRIYVKDWWSVVLNTIGPTYLLLTE
ncbi:MAG TPA: hypothetical protein PLN56_11320 [Methanoregulaceae archaeon]|nr:hypothetical protein [Methanoregulaceae archaeon]